MGSSGGSKKQKAASNDSGGVENKPLPAPGECKKPTSELKIILRRADNRTKRVGQIKVTATPNGKAALSSTSADQTGEANFGTVDPETYKIETALTPDQKKKYLPAPEQSIQVGERSKVSALVDVPPVVRLKILLTDKADKKLSGIKWAITTDKEEKGTTGGDGLIDVEVPYTAAEGELTLELPDEPDAFVKKAPTDAAPPAEGATPPYPIGIKHTSFLPEEEKAKQFPRKLKIAFEIQEIEDGEGTDGAEARLHNLGFRWDSPTALSRAVFHYQKWYMGQKWKGSGAIADIMSDLKTRHDNV